MKQGGSVARDKGGAVAWARSWAQSPVPPAYSLTYTSVQTLKLKLKVKKGSVSFCFSKGPGFWFPVSKW